MLKEKKKKKAKKKKTGCCCWCWSAAVMTLQITLEEDVISYSKITMIDARAKRRHTGLLEVQRRAGERWPAAAPTAQPSKGPFERRERAMPQTSTGTMTLWGKKTWSYVVAMLKKCWMISWFHFISWIRVIRKKRGWMDFFFFKYIPSTFFTGGRPNLPGRMQSGQKRFSGRLEEVWPDRPVLLITAL